MIDMVEPLEGYDAEMGRIEQALEQFGDDAVDRAGDAERITRYAWRRYQKAAVAGDLRELMAVDGVLDKAIARLADPSDLHLLKANLAFKLHRLGQVRAALAAAPTVREGREARMLAADLAFQEGRYDLARAGYEQLLDEERSWDGLARLAHFLFKMGDSVGAEWLYEEAKDSLTAKQMRPFAWLETQRGLMDFQRGRFAEAERRYSNADKAYPGYWLVKEHIAEVWGAQGRYADAISLLESIVETVDRPDLEQAIGELCELAGRAESATAAWKRKALASYLRSAQAGETHYYHHLADYYADVAGDGADATYWAMKDIDQRENFSTQAALAWALYRAGRLEEAVHWIDRALNSGACSAKLYHQAAQIHLAAGDSMKGASLMSLARRINPRVESFHVHH
jgi:tetratricopeptide (TPR) repeat protein